MLPSSTYNGAANWCNDPPMPGRIPRSFIDELLSRIDIVEVVDEYVPLKKAGRDYKACCPFHAEKTPSFTVSQPKQFYHCFGCQAHGTVIGFLMDYAHMEFVDAVDGLARRVGLEVPREVDASAARESTQPVYDLLARASAYFQRQLRHHPRAGRVVDYLKSRGVSGDIAAHFKVGFAPPGWDNIVRELGGAESDKRLLLSAGLAIERSAGGIYDRFRDRVIFPILDRRGRAVGFGGRVLEQDDTPKYLNSPETPVFHKGREIYGLSQARAAKPNQDRVIVVEGYMDVVALAQHCVSNVVATLGTAATEDHLSQLYRIWPDVVFCFDGDEAGRRAAWRALETALPLMRDGHQALFMFLPEGEDPDTLVRAEGAEQFAHRVDRAVSLGTFMFDRLEAQVDLDTIDGRSRLHELARPLLARLPRGSFERLVRKRLVEVTGIDASDLTKLSKGTRGTRRTKGRVVPRGKPAGPISPVRKAITLLIQYPELASAAQNPERFREIDLAGAPLLLELIELLAEKPNLTTGALIERFRGHDTGRHLGSLAAAGLDLEVGLEQELRDCLERVIEQDREQREEQRSKAIAGKDWGQLSEEDKHEYAQLTGKREGR